MIIADDDAQFRNRVATSLRRDGVAVVREAPDAETAVRAARETAPDVVILSLDMPGLSGVEGLRRLIAQAPGTRVLAVTSSGDPSRLADAIRAGAGGYLLKRPGETGIASLRVALALLAGIPVVARQEASA